MSMISHHRKTTEIVLYSQHRKRERERVDSHTLYDATHYSYFDVHKMFLSKDRIKCFKNVAMSAQIHSL